MSNTSGEDTDTALAHEDGRLSSDRRNRREDEQEHEKGGAGDDPHSRTVVSRSLRGNRTLVSQAIPTELGRVLRTQPSLRADQVIE